MTRSFCVRACVAVLCWLAAGTALRACPVCFQFDDASAAASVEAAVFVLGGITVGVLVPCAAFAVRLARREAAEAPADTRDARR